MSWPKVRLKDICDLQNGYAFKSSDYVDDSNTLSCRMSNIRPGGVFDIDYNARYLPDDLAEKYSQFLLKDGDVIIAMTDLADAPKILGVPTVVETEGRNVLLNQRVGKLVIKDSQRVHFPYLKLALNYPKVRSVYKRFAGGGLQINLGKNDLLSVEIPLPPLEEQKRIAAILDKADSVRRKRQQAIDLADDFLRSVFLDMFGSDLQRSTNVTTFGDVSILDAKMVDPCEEEYLDLLHIGPDRIEKSTGKLLPALTAREEQLISKKFLFDNQYILYSKIRPYLRKVAVPDFKALCSADMYPIKPVKGKVTREFMWMLLLSDYFDNYVSSLPARANIPKLNRIELAAFEFSLPDFSKIEKFTAVVKKSHQDTKRINSSYVESINLFNALSQKAFAGEL
ncbi:restriction endonuclease subunit S [Pseudoalteromonas tetraodonis]|uniref:restriction endonuclease subunit S n=1 Tax=Pseudoalteromonas tetraodonis TaxID=43659 RepID=UPI003A973A2D